MLTVMSILLPEGVWVHVSLCQGPLVDMASVCLAVMAVCGHAPLPLFLGQSPPAGASFMAGPTRESKGAACFSDGCI